MRLLHLIPLLLLLSVLFTACPYESSVPITVAQHEINNSLFGSWEKRKNANELYLVSKQNKFTYNILSYNKDLNKTEKFLGFISLVKERTFLNLWRADSLPVRYYLYEVKTGHDGFLTLRELSDNITEQFKSSSELEKFIAANMDNSFFFSKNEEVYLNRKLIADTKSQKDIRELDLQKSRTINYILAAGFIIITFLTLIIFFYNSKKRKAENNLIHEKINSVLKEQELRSVNDMMEGQEKERKRIASDLHDRLGSMLSTVKIYFNSLEDKVDEIKNLNLEYYTKATRLLDEACEEVRKISYDLNSGELAQFGLMVALEQLKKTIESLGGIEVRLLAFGMEKRLEKSFEIEIYRIIQELLNNTLKHAKASKTSIQLNCTGSNLNIVVEDNGIGFDPAATADGIGLKSIQTRLDKLNGRMEVDSGKGSGTTVIIDISLVAS